MIRPRRSDRRPRPRLRPILDRLEGRALMAFAGSLDPTFGGGTGTVLDPVNVGMGTGLYDLTQVQVESDGSIIAAGDVGYQSNPAFGVVRLNADGTPDTSFGTNGEADVALPAGTETDVGPTALLISTTGQIFVVGTLRTSNGVSTDGALVAEFNADGTPDTSFGTDGSVYIPPTAAGSPGLTLTNAVLESDGDLVLAGISAVTTPSSLEVAAIRLNADGSIDTTFGTDGLAAFPDLVTGGERSYTASTQGLAIQPNGQVVILATVYGGTTSNAALVRLNADGSQDTSLSQAGLLSVGTDVEGPLLIQSNGDFVFSNDDGVDRLNADGSLDTTFIIPKTVLPLYALTNIAIQSDGKILLFGGSTTGGQNFPTIRLTANLTLDPTFGIGGLQALSSLQPPTGHEASFDTGTVGPDDQIVVAGSNAYPLPGGGFEPATYLGFAQLTSTGTSARQGDFTGDGIADPAVFLAGSSTFVIGNSSGGAAQVVQLGTPGLGNTIPAPGNYYGTGQEDVAAYLADSGLYAIKDPTGQTAGLLLPIGIKGVGQTLPAPGDYFGVGSDQVAVYTAETATWDILAPGLKPGLVFNFGDPGVGNTIPVPGDYFGTGQDDVAVYLTQTGQWSILTPGLTSVITVNFGIPGAGNTIPVVGDFDPYDGLGHDELGVYLPSLGEFQYISSANKVVTVPFGLSGAGQTLPEVGDFTGLGTTEVAAYFPSSNQFVYRPSGGGADFGFTVGFASDGPIEPVTVVVPQAFLGSGIRTPGVSMEAVGSGVMGEADALDFLIPLITDAKKKAAGS